MRMVIINKNHLYSRSPTRKGLHHVHGVLPVPHAGHHQAAGSGTSADQALGTGRVLVAVQEGVIRPLYSQHGGIDPVLPEAPAAVPRHGVQLVLVLRVRYSIREHELPLDVHPGLSHRRLCHRQPHRGHPAIVPRAIHSTGDHGRLHRSRRPGAANKECC